MEDSLLIQTVRAFTPEELQQFGVFLESPYFNGGTNAKQNTRLFWFIAENKDGSPDAFLERSALLQAISPQAKLKFESNYLENRMSDLMAVIRKFVAWQEMERNWGEVYENLAMSRFFHARDLLVREEQALQRAKKHLEELPSSQVERPLLQYWLDRSTLERASFFNQRKGDLHTNATLKSLLVFHGIHLLEIATAVVQQERVVPDFKSEWTDLINEQRHLFRTYAYFDHPVIQLLDLAIQLIEDKTNDPYSLLDSYLRTFAASESGIPQQIAQALAAYARNFCTHQINLGHIAFRSTQLELYKQHLEKGWLYEHGNIPSAVFINMINAGLNFDEFDWVLRLLEKQHFAASGDAEQRVMRYAYAQYYFSLGEWAPAREHLGEVLQFSKFKDTSLEKLVRILEIKLLFEEKDALISTQLHNFLMFLRRNKHTIGTAAILMHHNFVKIMRALLNQVNKAPGADPKEPARLAFKAKTLDKIKNASFPLAERIWLQQQLEKY